MPDSDHRRAGAGAIDSRGGFPDPRTIPSKKGSVSDAEWAVRVDLAAAYRLIAHYGWDDMVYTHISARVPDEDGTSRFLINPFGLLFDEITASSLVKIDTDGNIVEESPYLINPAGFTIHSAVHMARHDVQCVIHLHTDYGIAVAAQREGLIPATQFSMHFYHDVAYHDYEGLALELEERERLVADLGDKHLMILRNHGTLSAGESCPAALMRIYILERACKAQILAQSGGADILVQSDDMAARVARQTEEAFTEGAQKIIWPTMLRLLDRTSPGFDL